MDSGLWSYRAGDRGNRVIVYERRRVGGIVYAKAWNRTRRRYVKLSLGFRLRDEGGVVIQELAHEARAYAWEQSRRIALGASTAAVLQPSTSWLYVIGHDRAVKIGRSTDVHNRIAAIQTANSHPLEVLAIVPADVIAEREAHTMWRHIRLQGEWFLRDRTLLSWAQGLMLFSETEIKG